MKIVRLGKTGLRVSRVGIGGISILRPTDDEAVKVIRHAFDLGINFIDTSFAYGVSEERFGKAIAGRRRQVVVATKTPARDKATSLEHLEQSLKHLSTDYIDLWQFHNISTEKEYEQILAPKGAMEAAQEALKEGKIKHIGFSTHSMNIALKAVSSRHFETIQFPFNFVNNEASSKLVSVAKKHDVGFIAMKPFAGGRLNKDVSLALRYLLQFDNVVPDPGIKKVEEIEEIVDIVNGSWKLTSDERQRMEKIRAELGTPFCHWCAYCQPCPQKVDIPCVMNARNIENYGEGFRRAVATAVETAKNCVKCGECEKKCPYHLPIREMMAENVKFYESVSHQRLGSKGDSTEK